MNGANPKVDHFLKQAKRWREEMTALRAIVRDTPLTEELKWRQPCYTLDGANVVILGGFKDYCLLGFFKGALLQDPEGVLSAPGENTQAVRQMRFTSLHEIADQEPLIRATLAEAIAAERAGLKVTLKETAEFAVPEEFQGRVDSSPELKRAFEALTPGRQRAYLLYFAAPKLSKTRVSRVEKCIPRILAGKGLDDR